MDTSLVDRFLLTVPLIQAPMAGVSTPLLAAEVCESGGLGSIGVGGTDAAAASAMIAEVKARTKRAFNVNLFVHDEPVADQSLDAVWLEALTPIFAEFGACPPSELRPIYRSFAANADMLAMLLEEAPPVVSFHFGLPSAETLAALRGRGIHLIATATSIEEAAAIEAAGLDGIVAQGIEAGGHRGVFDPAAPDNRLGAFALTRLLVKRTRLPVIAAGGIMDGAGIAAALALGATAAQLGTAFIACPESAADVGYCNVLRGAGAWHTTMTSLISGRPARSLANRFTALVDRLGGLQPPAYPIAYDAGKALHAAAMAAGEPGFGAQWAGQGAPLARAMPAGELVRTLERECQDALRH